MALAGLGLQAAGLLLLGTLSPDRAAMAYLAGTLLVGGPVAVVPVTRAALAVDRARTGAAAGVFSTVQQVGNALALGLVVAAAAFRTERAGTGDQLARAAGYRVGFLVAAVLVLAALPAAARLPGRADPVARPDGSPPARPDGLSPAVRESARAGRASAAPAGPARRSRRGRRPASG